MDVIRRTAIANVEDTLALKALGEADYSEARTQELIRLMQAAKPGTRIITDSALADKPGGVAAVIPPDVTKAQQDAMAGLISAMGAMPTAAGAVQSQVKCLRL